MKETGLSSLTYSFPWKIIVVLRMLGSFCVFCGERRGFGGRLSVAFLSLL